MLRFRKALNRCSVRIRFHVENSQESQTWPVAQSPAEHDRLCIFTLGGKEPDRSKNELADQDAIDVIGSQRSGDIEKRTLVRFENPVIETTDDSEHGKGNQ